MPFPYPFSDYLYFSGWAFLGVFFYSLCSWFKMGIPIAPDNAQQSNDPTNDGETESGDTGEEGQQTGLKRTDEEESIARTPEAMPSKNKKKRLRRKKAKKNKTACGSPEGTEEEGQHINRADEEEPTVGTEDRQVEDPGEAGQKTDIQRTDDGEATVGTLEDMTSGDTEEEGQQTNIKTTDEGVTVGTEEDGQAESSPWQRSQLKKGVKGCLDLMLRQPR